MPPAQALKFLQKYLSDTKTTPYLLPNARLEPTGPTVGSSTSSVTIHNLQRVEAGLRGEWLAPILDLEETAVPIAQGMDDGTNTGDGADQMQAEGWQDLEEYQREQSIEEGDVRPRSTAHRQEDDLEIPDVVVATTSKVKLTEEDKAKRKAEKKLRLKKEKKQKGQKEATQ